MVVVKVGSLVPLVCFAVTETAAIVWAKRQEHSRQRIVLWNGAIPTRHPLGLVTAVQSARNEFSACQCVTRVVFVRSCCCLCQTAHDRCDAVAGALALAARVLHGVNLDTRPPFPRLCPVESVAAVMLHAAAIVDFENSLCLFLSQWCSIPPREPVWHFEPCRLATRPRNHSEPFWVEASTL